MIIDPSLQRRGFLKCMTWAGTGVLWTVAGGVPTSLGIMGEAPKLSDYRSVSFWQRPSLLLTVHKSRIGQKKARDNLAKKLKKRGWGVIEIQLDEANPDAAQRILEFTEPQKFVFFVAGLDRGGGAEGKDAYRALNLSRERFVEQQLKVVFWLTVNEANSIPRLAPDFWAFRHRVIEFASPAPRLTAERLTPLLTWHAPEMEESLRALREKIRHEEKLLGELPKAPEALSMRIETCYLLGQAYWTAGDLDKALKALMAGIGLAQDKDFAHLNTWLLNGVAIVQAIGDRPYGVPVEHYFDGTKLYVLVSRREEQRKRVEELKKVLVGAHFGLTLALVKGLGGPRHRQEERAMHLPADRVDRPRAAARSSRATSAPRSQGSP